MKTKIISSVLIMTIGQGLALAQFPANSAVDDIQHEQAFAIHGTADSSAFGLGASGIGDFNNDGFDDIIIGARTADNGAENSGSSYVVFGTDGVLPVDFDIGQLNGSNGFAIHGENSSDTSGWSVSQAGDINADGIDDLLIGARGYSFSRGAVYIIFGTSTVMPASMNLSELDGSNGFRLVGTSTGDWLGSSVSHLGDVNNDGIDDIVVGALKADNSGTDSGAAYVVFGQATFTASINVADLDGSDGFLINATAAQSQLAAASYAGDINNDGINDILLGAYQASPGGIQSSGEAYVLFGKNTPFPANVELSSIDNTTGWVINGAAENDILGRGVSYAGDINGDGIDDIAINSNGNDTHASSSGAVYVIYGQADLISLPLNVTELDGTNGFVLYGESNGDSAGEELNYGGDFNGDGIDDLIIGAPMADAPNTNTGAVYLLHGWESGFPATFDLGDIDSADGFILKGNDNWDKTGSTVGHAGDFNGDGVSDLIIGVSGNEYNGSSVGTVFVVFGSTDVIFKDSFGD